MFFTLPERFAETAIQFSFLRQHDSVFKVPALLLLYRRYRPGPFC